MVNAGLSKYENASSNPAADNDIVVAHCRLSNVGVTKQTRDYGVSHVGGKKKTSQFGMSMLDTSRKHLTVDC